MVVGGATAAVTAACSLTTDLDGLAAGKKRAEDQSSAGAATAGDAGTTTLEDAGARKDDAGSLSPAEVYAAIVKSDQPVAYYPFDDAAGATSAKDVIGDRSARVLRGASGFGAEGVVGRGYASTTNGGLEVADVFDFAGKVPFTFEMWIKPTFNSQDQRLISKRKENVNPFLGYIIYISSENGLQFENWGVGLSAWSDGALPSESSGFTHVVLAISYATGKGNSRLYINSVAQKSGAYDNIENAADTDQPLRFIEYYRGLIDEIAIYDKPLPAERVTAHYKALRP